METLVIMAININGVRWHGQNKVAPFYHFQKPHRKTVTHALGRVLRRVETHACAHCGWMGWLANRTYRMLFIDDSRRVQAILTQTNRNRNHSPRRTPKAWPQRYKSETFGYSQKTIYLFEFRKDVIYLFLLHVFIINLPFNWHEKRNHWWNEQLLHEKNGIVRIQWKGNRLVNVNQIEIWAPKVTAPLGFVPFYRDKCMSQDGN